MFWTILIILCFEFVNVMRFESEYFVFWILIIYSVFWILIIYSVFWILIIYLYVNLLVYSSCFFRDFGSAFLYVPLRCYGFVGLDPRWRFA